MGKSPKCLVWPLPIPATSSPGPHHHYPCWGQATWPKCAINFHLIPQPGMPSHLLPKESPHFFKIQANIITLVSFPRPFSSVLLVSCVLYILLVYYTTLYKFQINVPFLPVESLNSNLSLCWPTWDLAQNKCSVNTWWVNARRQHITSPLNN